MGGGTPQIGAENGKSQDTRRNAVSLFPDDQWHVATHENFPEGWVPVIRRVLACGGHECPLDGVLCPLTRWQARDTQCCLQQGRHGAVLAVGRYLLLVLIRSSPPGPGPYHASVHTTPGMSHHGQANKSFLTFSDLPRTNF